ncbi:hypothetical protein CAPTEDRAFT_20272 [Capitella teleta]|uniref:Uncharacterized protein n=1 Tax=Capitella teleta TaxID=283909 RepID=R7URV4_CAPTE|nr:hypothetical protein CAPTEDRAFT_20272 [Capitella teleta]|eukprot:ELU06111.1 hypothetical protein CAPTEDRAFT_20272 [Capitella teleta]
MATAEREDTADYWLFPAIPEGLDRKATHQCLEETLDSILAFLSGHLVEYIWQNEPFALRVIPEKGSVPAHLYGSTCYGDNVEDEWFIIYLLKLITKEFPGIAAKVNDLDGEILLIEAADSLPKWLNPDNAVNRVFIFGGDVHVVPLPKGQGPQLGTLPAGEPAVSDALLCVRRHPDFTLAAPRIQRDIRRRIEGYPQKLDELKHRTQCYIPAALAAVLSHSPALIAPMVQAFYHRDPIDLKSCVTFKNFRPGTRVMASVSMTKCLYAQLMQQKFVADRRSGFVLPGTNTPKYKAHEVGMKIAHGAEILCSKCNSEVIQGSNMEEFAQKDLRWQRFKETLTAKGFFKGEIEGSRLYQKLTDDALLYFYASVSEHGSKDASAAGEKILRLTKSLDYDIEKMKQKEKDLPPSDDDSWLTLTPDQLDDLLKRHSACSPEEDVSLDQMASGMKSFVSKISDIEGAEFPNSDEVAFDPNSFMQSMQKVFDFDDDHSSASSEMDEYGSEDEMNSLSPGSPVKPLTTNKKPELAIREYMEIMDRELARTSIGESFEKQPPVAPPRAKKGGSARKAPPPRPPPPMRGAARPVSDEFDIDELDDDFKPVDVDMTLVKNILSSYENQQGAAGPMTNILGSMGMKGPRGGAAALDDSDDDLNI